ncbi:cell wall-binding repeat-containing protein [Bacillus shivajii]|uniref:cell wall-binding repeat-containing protein n=1 Tax=Bacillus shivajii TaxID=1983719 RepID=UPI001CFA5B1D|nr:cell wall-binding repeat-containing protein [Bacillus shivajii]UCZ52723.1 cell wall-binding repeat-containing protein [Bacillus shivajii]
MKNINLLFILSMVIIFTTSFATLQEASSGSDWNVNKEKSYDRVVSDTFDTHSIEKQFLIENSDEVSYVKQNNEVVSEIEYGYVEKITEFTVDNRTYLLIENRYDGSASTLKYVVVNVSEEDLEVIYSSEPLSRGLVKFDEENGNFHISTPVYSENDSLAEPSKVGVSYFDLASSSLNEIKSEEMSIAEYTKTFKQEEPEFGIFSSAESYSNPSWDEVNRLLTETAIEYNIPPEVFKAIAWQESRWRQFDTNGDPVIGFDGRGLGIMQITHTKEYLENNPDEERKLKYDIEYNIKKGAEILIDKWNWTNNLLPVVNDGDWKTIDNWYFAIVAYNGIGIINDPSNPESPAGYPYQNRIYDHMKNHGLLHVYQIPDGQLNIGVRKDNPNVMDFRANMHYETPKPHDRTKHLYEKGDRVKTTANSLTLRNEPGGSNIGTIPWGSELTITGGRKYQNNANNHFVWYPVEYNGQNGYVASSYLTDSNETIRKYGQTRFSTAAKISQQGWRTSDTVVLVRGDEFPDALAGAPLAYQLDAPMLVTRTNTLRPETKQEIKRLGAKNVVILGGHLAIDDSVEKVLEQDMGLNVDRIDGRTRFDTARMIADRLGDGNHEEAIVINVDAFADAMAIAPYASKNGIPILLTNKSNIPDVTKEVLDNVERTILLGGDLVISDSIANDMPNAQRFEGRTRYDTTEMIVSELNSNRDHAYVVSGEDFVDGLTGSVLAAKRGHSIILTDTDKLPPVSKNLMNDFNRVTIVGGPLAIAENVVNEIKNR